MVKAAVRVLILALMAAGPVQAQTGSVSGTVVDESGAVVPGASVTLTGPNVRRATTTGSEGEYRFTGLPPGNYDIVILRTGFVSGTSGNVSVGNGEVMVPAVTLAVAAMAEAVVVTASRAESALLDAPATMSVVTGETLEVLPAQNYGDVLRAVPGMNVVQMSARDVNVTSRQATGTLATSQLALLDGRSIYLDFFGLILWDFVPTNPDDIRQIEVVHGPASAVWGANALSGVVNIVTKSPRETQGTTNVTLNGGWFDRNVGSTAGRSAGSMFGGNITTSQAINDRWSYRVSAGYFNSDAYARPVGRIPVVVDPRDPSGATTVGGAIYPVDGTGPLGVAYQNTGTSQPKFDARVDQELSNGRVTYAGGVAGTSGTIYTGVGPFDIEPGSVMGYGKFGYTRGALKFGVFTNIVDAEAPNLLVPDPRSGGPLRMNFKTQTYDVDIGHSSLIGSRHVLSYGGNYRRNNFEITLAPNARDRNEIGAYLQDDIVAGKWRFSIGGRVDKYGNIDGAIFSPRLAAIFQPVPKHSLKVSFNRAFRSPSTVNNFLDIELINPVNLSGLAPLLPPPLQPAVQAPFNLLVRAIGSELPIGTVSQPKLNEESLTAYEIAYTAAIRNRTTGSVAFYVNRMDDSTNFAQLPPSLDPYTAANPPPGWVQRGLPPTLLTAMAQRGILLPRTAFTYLNLGPIRHKGLELAIDHRFSSAVSAFANYSWQGEPEVLDDPEPFPAIELTLPPTHRVNAGAMYDGRRFLGSANLNYTSQAFWSDVLTSAFHGYTDAFTLINGSFGVKWRDGAVITSVKGNNIFNRTVQQHVFGDLIRRSVMAEVRFKF